MHRTSYAVRPETDHGSAQRMPTAAYTLIGTYPV